MVVVDIGNNEVCYFGGFIEKNLQKVINLVQKKHHQFTGIIDGISGGGKSTLGIQICRRLDNSFNLSRIVFTPEQFLQALQKAKQGEAVLFDESAVLSSRSALSQWNKKIVQIMSMIRSKQIYVIFILPAVFDLDRNLVLFKADCLFHCYLRKHRRGFYSIYSRKRLKALYINGKKYYSYFVKPNFTERFTKKFLIDEKEYEKKKQEAISEITKVEITPTAKINKNQERYLLGRNRLIHRLHKDKLYTNTKIAEITGLSTKEITRILNKDVSNKEDIERPSLTDSLDKPPINSHKSDENKPKVKKGRGKSKVKPGLDEASQ